MMKKTLGIFALLTLVSGLFVGCEKEGKTEPESVAKEETPTCTATNWQPEIAKPQDDHSGHGHDHSGHDH